MNNRSIIILVVCIAVLLSGCSALSPGTGGDKGPTAGAPAPAPAAAGSIAEVNPAYTQYMGDLKAGKVIEKTKEGYYLGLIPTVADLSYMDGIQLDVENFKPDEYGNVKYAVLHQAMESRYDLRGMNKLTPVSQQGQCGSCWAFATTGSLESFLLTSEARNFSENNLKNKHGFNYGHSDGGNHYISTAYLSRWSGPVNEADDPYNPASSTSPSTVTVQKHVQNVLFIPNRGSSTDNNNIKWAVKTYGAVYSTLFYSDACFNGTSNSYYYNGSSSNNHAIDIVGWDDGYSKMNFSTPAPADGAFIVRNSWGDDWGDHGYFYVSYYDSGIGKDNAVFTAEPATNYAREYQYDPLGCVCAYGSATSTTYWGANVFAATASETLTSVGFYALKPGTIYEISIYTDPTSGPLNSTGPAARLNGSMNVPGYHTVTLDRGVQLVAGHKFSVVVKLTTPDYNYPIAIENPYSGYSTGATASAGQSYVSGDGTAWRDITTQYTKTNVCLKAFTTAQSPDAVVVSSTIPSSMITNQSYNVSVTMKNSGNMPWTAVDGIWLGSVWNESGDATRYFGTTKYDLVPGMIVWPGETYTWNFTMTASPYARTYGPKYQMFWGGHDFFGARQTNTIAVSTASPNAAAVSNTINGSMWSGNTYSASVTMKNTGNVPWSEAAGIRLGAVGNATGDAAKFAATRLALPAGVVVQPGSTYTWNFTMTAPAGGSYSVQYRMVQESTGWFGATVSKSVSVTAVNMNSAVDSRDIPDMMAKGIPYNATITMKNTGNVPWSDAAGYKLGAPTSGFGEKLSGTNRLSIAPGVAVQPGGTYTWTFTMKPPTDLADGTYPVEFRMISGSEWFGATAATNVDVKEPAYDAEIVSQNIPAKMTKGTVYNAKVTVRNTGNTPWSSAAGFVLGADEKAPGFSGNYVSLPAGTTVKPGDTYAFGFTMTASLSAGTYPVKYMMKKDTVWFGEAVSKNVQVVAGTTT
jgi:C1A family cysteine protease